jgi:hypothetical protein
MGLDMYAYSFNRDEIANPDDMVDLKPVKTGGDRAKPSRDWYWRKFNHLHGWMERLYREKGGAAEMFNCETVRLVEADLDRLEKDVNDTKSGVRKALAHTPGFFFGGAELEPGDLEDLEAFIKGAREELAAGRIVFYDSWW